MKRLVIVLFIVLLLLCGCIYRLEEETIENVRELNDTNLEVSSEKKTQKVIESHKINLDISEAKTTEDETESRDNEMDNNGEQLLVDVTETNEINLDTIELKTTDSSDSQMDVNDEEILVNVIQTDYANIDTSEIEINREGLAKYFPMELLRMTYSGGFENGGYSITVEIIEDDLVQIREKNTATAVVYVYRVSKDEITLVFKDVENYEENVSYISTQENCNNIILKTPIEVGTKWENKTITGVDVSITTDTGVYNAIEITEDNGYKEYFAPGIGLVKSEGVYYQNSVLIGIERLVSPEDRFIESLSYNMPYPKVEQLLGQPISKTDLDNDTEMLYGHYTMLEYPGLEITFNTDKEFNIDNSKSNIIELDITSSNYKTSSGITIGSFKTVLKSIYGITDFFSPLDEILIGSQRIRGFRRESVPFVDYDEYCYVHNSKEPIGLIFLIKDDRVVRILIRHLTAG